jgi:hypothetical protein
MTNRLNYRRNTTNPIPLFLSYCRLFVKSYHTTNPIAVYSSRTEPRRRRIVEILANRRQMSATEISKNYCASNIPAPKDAS